MILLPPHKLLLDLRKKLGLLLLHLVDLLGYLRERLHQRGCLGVIARKSRGLLVLVGSICEDIHEVRLDLLLLGQLLFKESALPDDWKYRVIVVVLL